MNEIVSMFKEDIKEKQLINNSVKAMNRAGKSNKHALPSDLLTDAQKSKLNGSVKTFNINGRMKWRQFKSMPEDCQEIYLKQILETYPVNRSNIADMFDISVSNLCKYLKSKPWKLSYRKSGIFFADEDDIKRWKEFTGIDLPVHNKHDKRVKDSKSSISIEDKELVSTNDQVKSSMKVPYINIEFKGELKLDDILAHLQLILGTDPIGHIKISFEECGKEG